MYVWKGPKTLKCRKSTFTVQRAILFNTMPKKIRNLKNITVDNLKNALDAHLKMIPGEP